MPITKISYSMILGAAANVLDFGADKTGVNDSSLHIAAAIAQVSAAGGGAVYIPTGVYKIAGNIEVESNVTIYGDGKSSVLSMSGSNRRCFNISGKSHIKICNFHIEGNKPAVGWETTDNYDFFVRIGDGSTSVDNSFIEIFGCYVANIGLDGLYIASATNVSVHDCQFINNRRWGVAVVPMQGCYYVDVSNCFFGCDYGGGPVGKEYPYGAYDYEPNGSEPGGFITVNNCKSDKGQFNFLPQNLVPDGCEMNNCCINDSRFSFSNANISINGCRVDGPNAQLTDDALQDVVASFTKYSNFVINNGKRPVLSGGNTNILPYSYGYFGPAISRNISGSGSISAAIPSIIDGAAVNLYELSFGPTTGIASGIFPTNVTINEGDDVFIFVEYNRTDGNNLAYNAVVCAFCNYTGAKQPPNGVHQMTACFRADANYVNPNLTLGLSGTPYTTVAMTIRKMFILVNPSRIDNSDFRVYA